jgi:L-alanine-DL-glutamate epimerase-like enolase superfamily enzyme
MKINNLSVITLIGKPGETYAEYCSPFSEQAAYIDIYPQYPKKQAHPETSPKMQENGEIVIRHRFLKIDSDEGAWGLAGPIGAEVVVYYLLRCIKPILMGMDPLDNEMLWDLMYYSAPHGRKGDYVLALSIADIALWDLKARYKGCPLYKLIGNVQQQKMPVYVNALGVVQEPTQIEKDVKSLLSQGYRAIKWGAMSGPAQGEKGIERMRTIFSLIRALLGAEKGLMLDVWASWNLDYTVKVLPLLQEMNLTWLEEPISPDLVDDYAVLRASSPIPIAFGEHEYTRWGYSSLLKNQTGDVYMPDPIWCGGITEILKIMELMMKNETKVSFHNTIPSLGVHLSSIYSPSVVAIAEYTPIVAEPLQYFLKNPCRPEQGYFTLPESLGVGLDLDESKIVERFETRFLDL